MRPPDIDEDPGFARDPQIAARRLARMKAEAARLLYESPPVLAADTVVWLNGRILGKPRDPDEARAMLAELRSREHRVVTAIAVMPAGKRSVLLRSPVTEVRIRAYTDADMGASIDRGDPFDKAGAYGIQDRALSPVEAYRGCYCNVVGLSLWQAMEVLERAEIPVSRPRLLPECRECPLAPPDREHVTFE